MNVEPYIQELINLSVRWGHVIAAIAWIGSSFYFMWLDRSLEKPREPSTKIEGFLWMVHSGGFYQVERRLIAPGEMPEKLHWFKWEATFTWLTGFLLLAIVYYSANGMYLVDPDVLSLSPAAAILLSIGLLALSWLIYDFLFQSALSRTSWANPVSLLLSAGLSYLLCHVFSGRAAFIHLGAIFGTLMVANVWMRILPAQKQMIAATERGELPDWNLSKIAKFRSVHNSYMTFPVIFVMISNHYPNLYAAQLNWVVLTLLILFGVAIRHIMIAGIKTASWALAPAVLSALLIVLLVKPSLPDEGGYNPQSSPVSVSTAHRIIIKRCTRCHSTTPSDETFDIAPAGIVFDTEDQIIAFADRIMARAVISKTMPLANKTSMTQKEREMLAVWLKSVTEED